MFSQSAVGIGGGGSGTVEANKDGGQAVLKHRMEYAIALLGTHSTVARLRRTRRFPLTEAAYNGHHDVLQVCVLMGSRHQTPDPSGTSARERDSENVLAPAWRVL